MSENQLRYPRELEVTDNTDYLSFGFYKYYPAFRKRGIRSDRVDYYNGTVGATGNENQGTASFWSSK